MNEQKVTARSIPAKLPFVQISWLGVVQSELVRKSLHFLIAFAPAFAFLSRPVCLWVLGMGVACYSLMEILRLEGIKVPVVSRLTALASRERDEGHFVKGPVTLGLGAFLAILWFPPAAAAIAIYSLAFGDGFASLVGRIFGNVRPAFMHGKSLEGSFACFLATFFATLGVSRSFTLALATACATTVVEALPLKDFDNLALPIVSGLIAIGFMAL